MTNALAIPRNARRKFMMTEPGAAAPPPSANLVRTLYFVFALSGLTGLVYEATWTRYLQLFLGHAAYAQVLVLTLFMGGMALGALLTSRLSRTRIAPLLAYVVIEAALGLAAIGFHPLFDGLTAYAYRTLLPGARDPGAALAAAMAARLRAHPAAVGPAGHDVPADERRRRAPRPRAGAGRVFSTLYFANSAGAVVGVLLAGFWLFERLRPAGDDGPGGHRQPDRGRHVALGRAATRPPTCLRRRNGRRVARVSGGGCWRSRS